MMLARITRLFITTVALALASGCGDKGVPAVVPVTLSGTTFQLELACTPDARYQGLSDRKSIAADGGMLFVFPDAAVRQFVMRRCLVPIDIVFLDANGRVVQQHAMPIEPPETRESPKRSYSSRYPAQFAIELRGGSLETLDLRNGQVVELPQTQLKQWAK